MDDRIARGVVDLVNLDRCPIEALDSDDGARFARAVRRRFLEDGLCVLPEFIRPEALAILFDETNRCIEDAWFCRGAHNVYLDEVPPDAPPDGVATREVRTFVGSIPCDRLKEDSSLQRLYEWEPLKDFIRAVLGMRRLHRFADPLSAFSVNVYVDGREQGWHFDESEFSVTLLVQAAESGGAFEYVPRIRARAEEMSIIERCSTATAATSASCRSKRVPSSSLSVGRPCTE